MSLRYPVGELGTREEYDRLWYSAQNFGDKTSYGFHDGADYNLKTGGDSDLGAPLYAVGTGKIVYYHNNSHPNSNFGRHMVLECNTPLGKRWFHYAHCQLITSQVKDVQKGEMIGKLGKSGTDWAHLHFSVFKVDPATLPRGIDSIAKTKEDLERYWEDPFVSLNASSESTEHVIPSWLNTMLQEKGLSLEREGEFRSFWEKAVKYDDEINRLKNEIITLNEVLSDRALQVSDLTERNKSLEGRMENIQEENNRLRTERDQATWENSKTSIKNQSLEKEVQALTEKIKKLQQNNSLFAYSWKERFISLFKGGE